MVEVSLNPVDVIKLVTDYYKKRSDHVENLLNSVAKEARAIANIWDEAIQELARGALSPTKAKRFSERLYAASKTPNAPDFARLREFYYVISGGVRGLSSTNQELALTYIGQLIIDRDVTKAAFERAVNADRKPVFLDPSNTLKMFNDIRASVDALHREAAALEVLAKTYRHRK